jgi:hypothetical protein
MTRRSFRLCVLCLFCAGSVASAEPRVRWLTEGKPRVEVTGLDSTANPKSLLRVYAVTDSPAPGDDAPSMAGEYRVESGTLLFEPQFPPEPGLTYRAVVRTAGQSLAADFTAPARPAAAATTVTRVYPTADKLPENLLKFYVHFSAPMRRGHIYDHIRLLEESGREVELPFLEIDEELWDPAMTRLTLFIDPGRIKRGVQPLEEVGPALVAGKKFRLVIDGGWKDAAGRPLARAFEKPFEVVPPDRDPPDPEGWKVTPPAPGSAAPLTITFPEPMDHALALRMIRIVDGNGNVTEGTAALEDGEKRWTFVPAVAWRPGRYAAVVQTTIEDLAGNNIGKPFEVDLAQGAKLVESRQTIRLPVTVAQTPAAARESMCVAWTDNILTISGANLPGGEMKVLYIEAYCQSGSTTRKWEQTVIGHRTRQVFARDDHTGVSLECILKDGVVVRHDITASADEVNFAITATNPTDKPSLAQWAQPCIRVDKFTGRSQKDYLEKCFIFLDGKLSRMPTRAWATEALYTPGQVWYPRNVDRNDVNPRPVSDAVPDNGLIGCFSADEKTIFAVAFEPYQELFQGVICCLHSDFRIGGLKPGETKKIRGKIYIVPADVNALLARYRHDFPEHDHNLAR